MRPRNREINIFNLSMLDVICGSLGTFILLMIILLPYYKKSNIDYQQEIQQIQQQLDASRQQFQEALTRASTAENQAKAALNRAQAAEKDMADVRRKVSASTRIPLEIMTRYLSAVPQTEKFEIALSAQGGTPPYSWKLEGKLPKGVNFDGVTGILSGTPDTSGNFDIRVVVTDAVDGRSGDPKPMTLKVIQKTEQKSEITAWILVVVAVFATMVANSLWQKHKTNVYIKKMKDQGYEPGWIPKG
jgi:hypothetical protein